MNNNNHFNTNNWIGTTHLDFFKNSSNALSNYTFNTSNILENDILIYSNINYLFTSNSSNSNIIYTSNTSNIILNRYDPMIENRYEITSLPLIPSITYPTNQIYINNSNTFGEIRFWTKSSSDFYKPGSPFPTEAPKYLVKIDVDGKLKSYYTYDPLLNATYGSGWVDIINSIVGLNADSVNQGTLIGGLEAQITANVASLQAQISQMLIEFEEDELITPGQRARIDQELQNLVEGSTVNGSRDTMTELYRLYQEGTRAYAFNRFREALDLITLRISQNSAAGFFLGIGGAAFGFLYSMQESIKHNEFLSTAVKIKISSNSNLTSNQKRYLYSSNNYDMNVNIINQLDSNYNLNLSQGFLNYNISNQQYISNLKCDNLYLNNGNISNINGISTNELTASGKIKQNGILLDNTYLTSNHIYNLAFNYTAERQYPSKAFTSSYNEGTATILNKLVYKQILFLDTTSISYGSGFYEIYSSSTYDIQTTKDRLFNFNSLETINCARWGINQYNSGTGNYQADASIDGSYYGDWIIIKLPLEILLTRYRIYQRTDFLTKAPAEWKVYGSKDGITFIEITEASQTSRLSSYSGGFYEKSFTTTFTTQYQYFGFVFNKLLSTSGQTDLSFAEIQLFGKEIISNYIVSNIYTTSNAVKNLIIYDTPQVSKHFAFYCQTSSPIYINGGNTQYYKYDIDMTKYTITGYIQIGSGSNDPYRIFRIRAFFGSCYFSKITNGLPDILHYEVYMSSKAHAGGSGTKEGINIFAIGYPNNSSLNIIPPNNLFILSNPSDNFNYITLVSTSPADCRVIIEDLIS